MTAVVAADEGRGATLTLGTNTWDTNALITSIQPEAVTRSPIETTHLGTTTARTFIAEDLVDNGGFTIEFLCNASDANATLPVLLAPETITITYAVVSTASTGQIITGSGFCTEYTPGVAQVGELIKGSAKFKWAGALTFTAAT
jgi:hypothetical protein